MQKKTMAFMHTKSISSFVLYKKSMAIDLELKKSNVPAIWSYLWNVCSFLKIFAVPMMPISE